MGELKSIERKRWIDCAKLMAIIAVAVDHTNRLFYTSKIIAQASYYSVSLFILLAGIGARIQFGQKNSKINEHDIYIYIYQFKKLLKIYIAYAVATAVLLAWYTRFLDWDTYINHLLHFSIQGPYYYLVFYFQLLMVTPLLTTWNEFCNKRRLHLLWNGLTLLFLCWFSSVCIRYTFILPVHGGGKYLFGGTYSILYYLGIVLEGYHTFERIKKQRAYLLPVLCVAWLIMLSVNCGGRRPLDSMLEPYWGYGTNPPGPQFMIFSIITLFLCYNLFSLLEEVRFLEKTINFFAFLGRYTLYTFMYHLLVRDVLLQTVLANVHNIWVLRLMGFIPMIIFPPAAVWGMQKFAAVLREKAGLPI